MDEYAEGLGEDDWDKLEETDPLNILDYIKSSIEILLSMKDEELDFVRKERREKVGRLRAQMKKMTGGEKGKRTTQPLQKKKEDFNTSAWGDSIMNSSKESGFRTFIFDAPPEYEEMIQKLEGDVRKHIRT